MFMSFLILHAFNWYVHDHRPSDFSNLIFILKTHRGTSALFLQISSPKLLPLAQHHIFLLLSSTHYVRNPTTDWEQIGVNMMLQKVSGLRS
jgi:hypothetical protein